MANAQYIRISNNIIEMKNMRLSAFPFNRITSLVNKFEDRISMRVSVLGACWSLMVFDLNAMSVIMFTKFDCVFVEMHSFELIA